MCKQFSAARSSLTVHQRLNPQVQELVIFSRYPLGYLSFLLFWFIEPFFECVKNFRESYVFHCSVIMVHFVSLSCDSHIRLPHLSWLVNNFFHFLLFPVVTVVFSDSLFTLSYIQTFVKNQIHFSEFFSNCLSFQNNSLRQLCYNITYVE